MTSYSTRGLVIGDSLSSMVYSDEPGATATQLWPNLLTEATGINFHNLSAPGSRVTAGAAPDFGIKYNANAFNFMRGAMLPRVAILFAGTNDWAGADTYGYHPSLPSFITDYRWIVGYWRSNGVPLLCIPPLWRSDEFGYGAPVYKAHPDGDRTLQTYRNWIFDLCRESVPNAEYLPHTAMELEPTDFVADGLHLNASGHAKVAVAVAARLIAMGITT